MGSSAGPATVAICGPRATGLGVRNMGSQVSDEGVPSIETRMISPSSTPDA